MKVYRDELEAARATAQRMTEKVMELEAERDADLLAELDDLRLAMKRLGGDVVSHLRRCPLAGSGR